MIAENVTKLLAEVGTNPFGEKVKIVAAVKERSAEEIREAIGAGISAIGDNYVQEFCTAHGLIQGAERHFIGHLQTNKVKYLVGKVDLYESLDRWELADELSRRSVRAGVVSPVLVQVNIGCEASKGGFAYEEAARAAAALQGTAGLRVRGFMAMLPNSDDEKLLASLARRMRALYEEARQTDPAIEILSMGMSGDWRLCVEQGSNLIRLGTALFGPRSYGKK